MYQMSRATWAELQAVGAETEGAWQFVTYSGRFMYGRQCLGLVCRNPVEAVIAVMRYLTDRLEDMDTDVDELLDALGTEVCQDQMGLDAVVYWPHLTLASGPCEVCGESYPEGAEPPAVGQRVGIWVCAACAEAHDLMEEGA